LFNGQFSAGKNYGDQKHSINRSPPETPKATKIILLGSAAFRCRQNNFILKNAQVLYSDTPFRISFVPRIQFLKRFKNTNFLLDSVPAFIPERKSL